MTCSLVGQDLRSRWPGVWSRPDAMQLQVRPGTPMSLSGFWHQRSMQCSRTRSHGTAGLWLAPGGVMRGCGAPAAAGVCQLLTPLPAAVVQQRAIRQGHKSGCANPPADDQALVWLMGVEQQDVHAHASFGVVQHDLQPWGPSAARWKRNLGQQSGGMHLWQIWQARSLETVTLLQRQRQLGAAGQVGRRWRCLLTTLQGSQMQRRHLMRQWQQLVQPGVFHPFCARTQAACKVGSSLAQAHLCRACASSSRARWCSAFCRLLTTEAVRSFSPAALVAPSRKGATTRSATCACAPALTPCTALCGVSCRCLGGVPAARSRPMAPWAPCPAAW